MFIIQDWTGRTLFDGMMFPSFEDGWNHIYMNVKDAGDNTYDDYYVVESEG